MKQYRLVDNVLGWVAFIIAAYTYCSTIEPTASFWDCPEFIDTGYKLQIGHPPGAPFFMLTANLFSHFVSDPSMVARMVNTMSALLSATTNHAPHAQTCAEQLERANHLKANCHRGQRHGGRTYLHVV